MKLLAVALGATLSLTSIAHAGSVSGPTYEYDIQSPSALSGIQPSCVSYIRNIVWWDHGAASFINEIQNVTGASRRQASDAAKRYCRQTRLGNSYALQDLEREISQMRRY